MFINNSHTPDKKNSYLTKFKKKRIQTTDKENKIQNLSNLSTNKDSSDDCKSYCDSVDFYRHENHQLKKLVFQLKFQMKSQVESCLIEQKHNLKSVMSQYQQYVDKLKVSKKQVTQECDDWKQKFEQQQQIIEQQQLQICNQSKIIEGHLHTVDTIQLLHLQEMSKYRSEMEEILNIKDQTIDELNKIVQFQLTQ